MEMDPQIQAAKRALREAALGAVRRMGAAEKTLASGQARAVLTAQPLWREAKSVLFYAPMEEELDVWPLLGEALGSGKVVGLPRYHPKTGLYAPCQVRDLTRDVQVGHYGIREPAGHCAGFLLNRLDLILVPGVAYDLQGNRLGRGKGYYDRLLAVLRGVTCGVAFDVQIASAIPVDTHDVRVNRILTPTLWHAVCDGGAVLE